MKFQNPGIKILTICWVILILLTVGTMFSGNVSTTDSLSSPMIILLGVITWFKSMLILRYYLNLQSSTKGWNRAFNFALLVLLSILVAIFLIGKLYN